MKFVKMQGAGNDFILIENFKEQFSGKESSQIAVKLCDRRFGIGADGIMLLGSPHKGGDVSMLFINSDGTLGEMCGNGARCVTRYCIDKKIVNGKKVIIESTAGLVFGVETDLGEYMVRLNNPCNYKVVSDSISYVELGKPGIPHAVVHSPEWEKIERDVLREKARRIHYEPSFPKGANVTLWDKKDNILHCITFERGVEDFTLACGTGAGSTAWTLNQEGVINKEATLIFPGGVLKIDLNQGISLIGPAEIVFDGSIQI